MEGGKELCVRRAKKWVGQADKIGKEGLQAFIARLVAFRQASALFGGKGRGRCSDISSLPQSHRWQASVCPDGQKITIWASPVIGMRSFPYLSGVRERTEMRVSA